MYHCVIKIKHNRKLSSLVKVENNLKSICSKLLREVSLEFLKTIAKPGIFWVWKIITQKSWAPFAKNCPTASFKKIRCHLRESSAVTVRLVGRTENEEFLGPQITITKARLWPHSNLTRTTTKKK